MNRRATRRAVAHSILVAAGAIGLAAPAVAAGPLGVPIQVTRDAFACRDLSDAVRLGLRMADSDKPAFLSFYMERQKAGACESLRNGTIAALFDSHDEQGLHFACIRQPGDDACFWVLDPRFGPAPY